MNYLWNLHTSSGSTLSLEASWRPVYKSLVPLWSSLMLCPFHQLLILIPGPDGEVSQVLEYCESQVCSVYQGQRHDLGTKKGQLLSKAHRSLQKLCFALQILGPQWTNQVTDYCFLHKMSFPHLCFSSFLAPSTYQAIEGISSYMPLW